MRDWGVIRTGVGAALIAVTLGHAGSVAGADTAVRAGWWSQIAPAPSPPDVPEDGLHVSGSVSGPTAVAAVAYELPEGAIATTLSLELVGVSPRADELRACAIPLDAAGFEPAHNGAWTELPAYDCDVGAAPVVLADTTATFAVDLLQQGNVLAVALVPGATDRASIEKPTAESLVITLPAPPSPSSSSTGSAPQSAMFPSIDAAPAAASFTAPPAAPAPAVPVERRTVTPDEPSSLAADSSVVASPAPASTEQPLRTRIGGALGFGLLLCALLFYSQGRGLLGARVGNT